MSCPFNAERAHEALVPRQQANLFELNRTTPAAAKRIEGVHFLCLDRIRKAVRASPSNIQGREPYASIAPVLFHAGAPSDGSPRAFAPRCAERLVPKLTS